jgi:hypothetical protein
MRPERQLRLKQITCISTTWVNEYGDFTTVIPVNVARRGGFPFWRNVGRDQKSRAEGRQVCRSRVKASGQIRRLLIPPRSCGIVDG